MLPPDSRNVNALWGSVLAETLVRVGVGQAVIAPGSRSGPLATALARHPGIEAIPVLDERSAGFFALGLAKRARRPVVLVCTSGTAAANFFPAVIEARESGVPLVVLTADRPPELRACASGQTIDQQKLFGLYVSFQHELAVPEAHGPRLAYLRQTVAHACLRAVQPDPGPVHLNVPFRDPLAPLPDGAAQQLAAQVDWQAFFAHLGAPADLATAGALPPLPRSAAGVTAAAPAAPGPPAATAAAVGELSRRLGWPVLADALSPARHHADRVPRLVSAYDAILRHGTAAAELWPEAVLCLEGWPTSKILRGWLEACAAPTWLVSERSDNRDALHGRTRYIRTSVAALAAGVPPRGGAEDYARLWDARERRTRAALDAGLAAEPGLFEPKAAWLLARHLPEGTPLFVASSMPVRDAEYFWPGNSRRIRPRFNRGANGIDGTLSAALGVAHGGPPAALLTGDLALLHDANGFLIRPKLRGSLTIVLINNRGGGIFEHLAVAGFDPPFEEFFATPQEADFGTLCAAHGVEHVRVGDWEQFAALVSVLPAAGVRVLEVPTDRKADAAARRRLLAEAGG